MLTTSKQTLKRMAALVWFVGVVVLLLKSTTLFLQAIEEGVATPIVLVAIFGGILIGWFKAKLLFIKLCKKNLQRIRELNAPKIWQFYRSRFFFFLFLMILAGRYLPMLVQGSGVFLLLLAIVELSIATALCLSIHCFRSKEHY